MISFPDTEKKLKGRISSYKSALNKEKKEYDTIESEIEALEIQKTALEALFTSDSLTGKEINESSLKLQEIKSAISQKEERWFELSSKLEG